MDSVLLPKNLERTLTYKGAKCEMDGKEPKRAFNVPEIEAFPPPLPPLSNFASTVCTCGCVRYGGGGL